MSIRAKIILVVLPLIITTLLLTGISSFFAATNAISGIATDFLGFKAAELQKYAESQWLLLVENNLTERPAMVAATKAAIDTYARSIIRSPTEVIFALDAQAEVVMSTSQLEIRPQDGARLRELVDRRSTGLVTLRVGGTDRVAKGFFFEPFQWFLVVSEARDTFYSKVNQITQRTVAILALAIVLGLVMILVFAKYLTDPLKKVVGTMQDIMTTSDLSKRVTVEYHDEIGRLAHTFNLMVGELEKAYNQIKSYAFKAVLAQKREHKIRNIFQKYVPSDVIDQFFKSPESMLVGEDRVLSVLFSDIRSFTTISEGLRPDELVDSLNRYFSVMVEIIMDRHRGIIDKYIGDAIMAFFGAPVRHDDDALQSVLAGIEMHDGLEQFNEHQRKVGRPEFHIGVGINYGVVTVGNIGTEKKMDYTVIGDMVNLASRLEGLTKKYRQPLLISESLHAKVQSQIPCRLLDTVAVKGKTKGVRIYTARKELSDTENMVWGLHNTAMGHYYGREFDKAIDCFQEVLAIASQDTNACMILERCKAYRNNPPGEGWDGVEIMTEK